jgi:AcrR family transcriptional regulator
MTNSQRSALGAAMKPPAEKRTRLIDAARELLHRRGIERTTLADVAEASGVPLGNVYYYFKTKNELIAAVVDSHLDEQQAAIDAFDTLPSPQERLKAFIRMSAGQADVVAESGCPMGSLCTELDKRDDGLDRLAVPLMRMALDWVESQFQAMGRSDARELAVAFVAAYQGAAVLTNTLRDPTLLVSEGDRLQRWIDAIA